MTSGINRATRTRNSNWRTHSQVIELRTASERSAVEELELQVQIARDSNVLRVKDFDAAYWPVKSRARGSDAGSGGLHFTIDKGGKGTTPTPFPEPFFGFAKVMVCAFEKRSDKGFSAANLQTVIAACRWLYQQFGLRPPLPSALTHGDFVAAAQAAVAAMGEGAANIGSKLAFISQTMDSLRLSSAAINWRNSVKRKAKHNSIGPVADRRRNELMPDPAIIDALADISSRTDLSDGDRLLQRGTEMLVSAGFRINELLTIPRDCLVVEAELDDIGEQLIDNFGRPKLRIGIRYWPEKGASETLIKWIPSVMNDVVQRAVADIQLITEPAWLAAAKQHASPGTSSLGDPWDSYPDDYAMSKPEICQALGVVDVHQFLKMNTIPFVSDWSLFEERNRYSTATRVRLGDLRRHLYDRSDRGNVLRQGEGHQELRDCLFLTPAFFVKRSMSGGLKGTVVLLKDANFNVYLVGIKGAPSVFERLCYIGSDGETLRCATHQIRHWLNTLALEGGLSDIDLARWMGRQNVSQNRAYDHRSPVDRARRAADRMRAGETAGPVATATRQIRDPIRREEFIKSKHHTMHTTDLGGCVHPWDALPCQHHGNCPDCSELRVEKGNPQQRASAFQKLEEAEAELVEAREEHADYTIGADRWMEAHERTANALRVIVEIHDDPTIPDGHIVQVDQRMILARSRG